MTSRGCISSGTSSYISGTAGASASVSSPSAHSAKTNNSGAASPNAINVYIFIHIRVLRPRNLPRTLAHAWNRSRLVWPLGPMLYAYF